MHDCVEQYILTTDDGTEVLAWLLYFESVDKQKQMLQSFLPVKYTLPKLCLVPRLLERHCQRCVFIRV